VTAACSRQERSLVVRRAGLSLFGALSVCLSLVAATSSAAPANVEPCRLSRFAVRLGPYVGEATGQHTLALRLVNRGRAVCVVDGYPRVRLYDRAGAIPFSINHRGDQTISPRRPRPVFVHPGGTVFVVLNKYRCDARSLRETRRIAIGSTRVRVPGTASIMFRDPGAIRFPYRIPDYCGRGDPGSILTVSPFVASVEAALAH
jgi:Protein of unknown function (DUF4232)